ncbi:D-inositol-3-phosphate glycosyltransferase [Vallicoccus soli]|uniref:D-inositol-3-phosphate glycosyltransferase n=1 Tax=Vallicoccus soli TaxID=2339232 RepID=A0A3A3Z235_9ACTN|nr:D-inositol-3-phosphate glycosyltransferase [Vallicoccus soli]
MLSVHTSPLDQPGTGDAGGLNVYVVELARRLAARGTEVEVLTRAARPGLAPAVELADGVLVRHLPAGPYEPLPKEDLPSQLCALVAGALRVEAGRAAGHYDLVHSHYWLSGQVGWLAAERWGVPLVHTMHTMARVKNLSLAAGDAPEPRSREIGEQQVVDAADRLLANTRLEAGQLVDLYGADPRRVAVVPPGVDLELFRPGDRAAARARLGVRPDAAVLLFVGRVQPLKAPDVLVRAAARLVADDPALRRRLQVVVLGGPSGSGTERPRALEELARSEGVADVVTLAPPVPRPVLADWYRAADVSVVPSYSESFGLVAVEAQACGTPVVASRVGGLPVAVRDGVSGLLVDGHDPDDYARVLRRLLDEPRLRQRLSLGAVEHAARHGWDATADGVLAAYRGALDDAEAARAARGRAAGRGA